MKSGPNMSGQKVKNEKSFLDETKNIFNYL